MSQTAIRHRFEPRPTQCRGVRTLAGWRLRLHEITLPGELLDQAQFDQGLGMAAEALPQPPSAEGRLGVGFVVLHQGREMDYVVVCWWARENELPIRVFVREREPKSAWRPGRGDESICVWDLEVLKGERDLYVRTVLARAGSADVEAYLAAPP